MKKLPLVFAVVFTVAIPACDRQMAARLELTAAEVKSLQADSKQTADQIAEASKLQEKLRKDLAAALASAEEVRSRMAADVASVRAKADEQQKKSDRQMEELRAGLAAMKVALNKMGETLEARSKAAEAAPLQNSSLSENKPSMAQSGGDPALVKKGIDAGSGTPSSVNTKPANDPTDAPPKNAARSGAVRTGGYKFIERSPDSGSDNVKSSRPDFRYAKNFVAPMGGIFFRYDGRSGTWKSGKGSVLPGGDPAVFVDRMERMLKSDGKIPKDAALMLAPDGSIHIQSRGGGGVKSPAVPETTRVPDPKELGKTAPPPDPNAIGGGNSPPVTPKEQ